MVSWVEKYDIASLEDPMAEDDWEGWQRIRSALGDRCQLIGDDHFTRNLARIERGIAAGTANAVLIKLNQIGTVTETLHAIRRTQAAGWLPVISARSGETEDTFIAHLAVATNAGQLKVGSFSRSERLAKWNEILRIQRQLGERAQFIGAEIFSRAGISLPTRT
jgi:enolase